MRKLLFTLAFPALLAACNPSTEDPSNEQASAQAASSSGAIPVTLKQEDGRFQIYRGEQAYFIRGAGGSNNIPLLAASGGNSLRTWGTNDAERILDEAHKHGLTVMMGLRLGHERHGFDYNDEAAVARQKEEVREQVLKYKDHPALLVWGLGNEVDLLYTNTKVWYAIEDIAKMVRELDPNHLITTVTAGIDAEKAQLIMERVPSIDYLSVNIYGGLETLPQTLKDIGWTGAYVVTEWGPTGHWQITRTDWDVPIEQTTTEKAKSYRERYEAGVLGAPDQALGSYAFLWGQKQETTPTWYGMFLESGEATEVVDTMQFLWTGEWPKERAPSIRSFLIDGKKAEESIYLEAGKTYIAKLNAFHPDNEAFTVRWEFLPESTDIRAGGDPEARPKAVEGLIVNDDGKGTLEFTAPDEGGPYRLFAYVTNRFNRAAAANVPFFVR
ncbi:MAG TPA: glycoside hydrolase family 2 TIM barrel-domain containing protein [Cellvibrio sp.]|nr:glycoside hydrolase family 2 TIM barrel-domain containing protein [Cellvibrio sp.]